MARTNSSRAIHGASEAGDPGARRSRSAAGFTPKLSGFCRGRTLVAVDRRSRSGARGLEVQAPYRQATTHQCGPPSQPASPADADATPGRGQRPAEGNIVTVLANTVPGRRFGRHGVDIALPRNVVRFFDTDALPHGSISLFGNVGAYMHYVGREFSAAWDWKNAKASEHLERIRLVRVEVDGDEETHGDDWVQLLRPIEENKAVLIEVFEVDDLRIRKTEAAKQAVKLAQGKKVAGYRRVPAHEGPHWDNLCPDPFCWRTFDNAASLADHCINAHHTEPLVSPVYRQPMYHLPNITNCMGALVTSALAAHDIGATRTKSRKVNGALVNCALSRAMDAPSAGASYTLARRMEEFVRMTGNDDPAWKEANWTTKAVINGKEVAVPGPAQWSMHDSQSLRWTMNALLKVFPENVAKAGITPVRHCVACSYRSATTATEDAPRYLAVGLTFNNVDQLSKFAVTGNPSATRCEHCGGADTMETRWTQRYQRKRAAAGFSSPPNGRGRAGMRAAGAFGAGQLPQPAGPQYEETCDPLSESTGFVMFSAKGIQLPTEAQTAQGVQVGDTAAKIRMYVRGLCVLTEDGSRAYYVRLHKDTGGAFTWHNMCSAGKPQQWDRVAKEKVVGVALAKDPPTALKIHAVAEEELQRQATKPKARAALGAGADTNAPASAVSQPADNAAPAAAPVHADPADFPFVPPPLPGAAPAQSADTVSPPLPDAAPSRRAGAGGRLAPLVLQTADNFIDPSLDPEPVDFWGMNDEAEAAAARGTDAGERGPDRVA